MKKINGEFKEIAKSKYTGTLTASGYLPDQSYFQESFVITSPVLDGGEKFGDKLNAKLEEMVEAYGHYIAISYSGDFQKEVDRCIQSGYTKGYPIW